MTNHPIAEQVRAVRAGSETARDLASSVRQAVEAAEPRLRAWVALSDDLEAQVAGVDGGGPLAGVSIGVKDIIDVTGLPTRAGSVLTSAEPAAADAACVARLKALGAVVQGKTVTTEFAYLHPGSTRNPHAPGHTPGGSSSGSAAAVGAQTIPLALGTQTAGSLTRPAAFCGTAGMVLPPGSVDMTGIVGLSHSLDSLGLMTRTVEDLRYVYAAFTSGAISPVLPEVRVWDGDGVAEPSPEMSALVSSIPALTAQFGTGTAPLEWTAHVRRLTEEHLEVMSYEALRERRFEFENHAEQLSAPLLSLLRDGEKVSPERHAAVLRYRDDALEMLSAVLGDAVIVGPATPGPAPAGLGATGSSVYNRAWQLLGLPVVVVPGARTPAGLPLGMQIIGLPGAETGMLALGVELERVLRGQTMPPGPSA